MQSPMNSHFRLIGCPRDSNSAELLPFDYTVVDTERFDRPDPRHANIVHEDIRCVTKWRGDAKVYERRAGVHATLRFSRASASHDMRRTGLTTPSTYNSAVSPSRLFLRIGDDHRPALENAAAASERTRPSSQMWVQELRSGGVVVFRATSEM